MQTLIFIILWIVGFYFVSGFVSSVAEMPQLLSIVISAIITYFLVNWVSRLIFKQRNY